MSAETLSWLNRNVLVGFTAKRGHAWHYKASEQGDEPNHYTGAIPVGDVQRRLFAWEPVSTPVFTRRNGEYVAIEGKQAITASDNGDVLGIFSDGYQPHPYSEWLLDNVSNILDADLGIASAGLLRNRGVAWVQVETPDSVETPEGVTFRPFVTAATSLDGTLATTYQSAVTAVVCDNTLSAALSEQSGRIKIKHTRNSALRIADARQALGIIYATADAFSAQVATLCNYSVSNAEWQRLIEASVPVKDKEGKALTLATNKREALVSLYDADARVTPWKGTAFGVLQAFNTYSTHLANVRGGERVERIQMAALTGKMAEADAQVLSSLAQVTGRPLVLDGRPMVLAGR